MSPRLDPRVPQRRAPHLAGVVTDRLVHELEGLGSLVGHKAVRQVGLEVFDRRLTLHVDDGVDARAQVVVGQSDHGARLHGRVFLQRAIASSAWRAISRQCGGRIAAGAVVLSPADAGESDDRTDIRPARRQRRDFARDVEIGLLDADGDGFGHGRLAAGHGRKESDLARAGDHRLRLDVGVIDGGTDHLRGLEGMGIFVAARAQPADQVADRGTQTPWHSSRVEMGSLEHLAKTSAAQNAELHTARDGRRRAEEDLALKARELNLSLEEKVRLGRDLHDGIIQSLYALGLTLESARALIRTDPAEAERRLEACGSAIN
eukprot:gene7925-10723_t